MKKLIILLLISINCLSTSLLAVKASTTVRDTHRVKAISMLQNENIYIRSFSGFALTQAMKETSINMANNLDLPVYDQIGRNNNIEVERRLSRKRATRRQQINAPDKKGPSFSDIADEVQKNKSAAFRSKTLTDNSLAFLNNH
ncbi:hypothetical protein DID80_00820 [Candidatus Marinamargulisbacteria bacterium SCGC AAA071-K20]|nr:hypothetical protein DID80_00820 [Candidatus Marinamargulisbacteria bacterium SCGC AAA071-K20]